MPFRYLKPNVEDDEKREHFPIVLANNNSLKGGRGELFNFSDPKKRNGSSKVERGAFPFPSFYLFLFLLFCVFPFLFAFGISSRAF